MTVATRLKHAWNTFMNRDSYVSRMSIGPSYGYRPDRPLFSRGNERSIITSVYNRIALDVSSMTVQHVRLDGSDRFKEVIESGLNNCLTVEANVDQTGRAFMQDIVMSMLDEGCVAIIPVDTNFDPEKTGGIDIETMRTGKILEWFPQHVKVRVYNDQRGEKEDILVPKSTVGIVENPFYAVMNEPNSTMQRLIRKLNLLDAIDEQNSSGKLNLIIQLPYVIKTEARRQQAELRRQDIENQLASSKYGVAYTDGTEHVVQLNRPVENKLMSQIEYLTSMLYSQLGLTQGILDGSADDKTMQNYLTRIVEPMPRLPRSLPKMPRKRRPAPPNPLRRLHSPREASRPLRKMSTSRPQTRKKLPPVLRRLRQRRRTRKRSPSRRHRRPRTPRQRRRLPRERSRPPRSA